MGLILLEISRRSTWCPRKISYLFSNLIYSRLNTTQFSKKSGAAAIIVRAHLKCKTKGLDKKKRTRHRAYLTQNFELINVVPKKTLLSLTKREKMASENLYETL